MVLEFFGHLPSIAVPNSTATTKGSAINAQTLINNTIIIIACTVAILLITRLLLHMAVQSKQLRTRHLAPSMYFYLLMHLAGCTTTLPYYGYIALQWVGAARCNPLLFFVLLQLRFIYALVSTMPITILALDRCLVVRLASRWTYEWRRWLVVSGCHLISVLLGLNLLLISSDGPPLSPESTDDACPSPVIGAMHGTYKARMKNLLEAGDIAVSFWLIYLLRMQKCSQWSKRISRRAQMTTTVQRLVIMEMMFNVLPTYLSITVGYSRDRGGGDIC